MCKKCIKIKNGSLKHKQIEETMASSNSSPCVRSVYLITYSQATEDWSRQSFAEAVVEQFENTEARVRQWVCCQERHENNGIHFHVAVKLDRQKRWLRVRNQLAQVHGINVNFSNRHTNYFDAWEYVAKEDVEFLQSEEHPDLSAGFVPRTASAMNARRSTSSSTIGDNATTRGKRRFDALDMSDVIVAKNINSKAELLRLANEQRQEGKRDLALYVLNNVDKCVKLISTTWEMENVRREMERDSKTRIQLLRQFHNGECVPACDGQWLQCALQTLDRNSIDVKQFSKAVRDLLELGRGKHRNILMVGPANCGKSFILNPITKIFKAFVNPAQNSFAWVGAEKAEIVYLNDLRWSEKLIPWNNFLQLLEGAEVHLSAPKNHCPEDIIFNKDTPIFATSIGKIRKYVAGVVHEGETEMMDCRWKVIKFFNQISQDEVKEIPPCPNCFAKLILDN